METSSKKIRIVIDEDLKEIIPSYFASRINDVGMLGSQAQLRVFSGIGRTQEDGFKQLVLHLIAYRIDQFAIPRGFFSGHAPFNLRLPFRQIKGLEGAPAVIR